MIRFSYRSLGCVVVLFIVLAVAASLHARTWTDKRGRTIEAKFVRLLGEQVVLQLANGKIAKIPLATLSDDDVAFLRGEQLEAGIRVWTDLTGRQVQAQFARVADGKVYIKVNGETNPVEFADLTTADRLYVRTQLSDDEQKELLPAADASESLPPARAWTDVDGNVVQGQLDRVLPGGVFLAVDGMTRIVRMEKLSEADHDYLREYLEPRGLANLVPAKPKPIEPPDEVAAVDPPPPPTETESTPTVTPPPPPPPVITPRPTPPARPPYSPPSTPPPSYTPPAAPTPQYVEQYVGICGECNKEVPAHLGAGDHCPHCGVYWDYEEDEHGNAIDKDGKKLGWWTKIGGGGIVFIILVIVRIVYALKSD